MKRLHDRFEALAGAIALGEATDEQRRAYREHIVACSRCLNELGGEHEIERTMRTVAQARESEIWRPDLRGFIEREQRRRARLWRLSLSVLAVCLGVAFGMRALLGAVANNPAPAQVALRQPAAPVSASQLTAAPRRLPVERNVERIARVPAPSVPSIVRIAATKPHPKTSTIAHAAVHPAVHPVAKARPPQTKSNIPIWRRDDRAWSALAKATAPLVPSAPAPLTNSAESIHVADSIHVAAAYTTRDAAPVGGEGAINPQPPPIAYDEGAEGTTVFEVFVDERGNPTKCAITKSSTYEVLDDSVCKAAMKARYTPKTVGGRPVPGTFRDAFTFRMSPDTQSVNTVPSAAPLRRQPPVPPPLQQQQQPPQPEQY